MMPREIIGPYKTEADAADAAYRATRAAEEPHTIAGLGPTADAVAVWLVVRGRIRECWLEKKLAAPPTIAWPLFWISPAGAKPEEAETAELCLIAMASPQGTAPTPIRSDAGGGWPVPSDETPRPKGKRA